MKVEMSAADLSKVQLMLGGIKNAPTRVIVRSINKTETGVVAKAAGEIAKHYNLTQKRIKKDFKKITASYAKPSGRVIAKGKPVSLISFKSTRQTAKGVSCQIKKTRPRFILKHGFIAIPKDVKQSTRDEGRGKQVFWRASKIRNKKRLFAAWKRSPKYGILPERYRYDIHRLTGPRIEDEYGKPRTHNVVMKYAGERFQTVIDQELKYELSKL